jgi:hypothetical protein
MARRKNAAALFEVIHSDNRFTARHQPGSWSLRPPGWISRLFRQRPSDAPAPVETIDYAASEPAAQSAPRGGPSLLARLFALMPAMPRIGMSVDADRQLVRFQLSYTGALISAFGLVVAIGLAYMAGRGSGPRPLPALTDLTTEELRQGPAFADVLDVGDDATTPPVAMAAAPTVTTPQPPQSTATTAAGRQTASRTTVATAQQPAATGSNQAMRPSQFNEPKPPATYMVSDEKRTVGLQYVVIQSYPEEEKALAESAAQTLRDNGVNCTVERGLPYAPSWYCVVGIMGFARTKDVPEYEGYTNRILQISSQFAGTSKFKKFEPKPLRWREMKSTGAPATTTDKPAAAPTPKQ